MNGFSEYLLNRNALALQPAQRPLNAFAEGYPDQAIEDFKRRVALDTMFRRPADELRLPDAASGSITATPRPQTTLEAWLSGLGRVATEAMAPIERLGSGILGKTTLDSYPAIDEINTPAAVKEAMVRDSLLSLMNTGIGPTLLGKPTATGISTFGGLKAKPPAGSNATAPLWRSQMEDVLSAKLPGKGEPAQIAQTLEAFAKKGEFKPEELEWSGVRDWLKQQSGKVSKDDVLSYLRENNVQVQEVVKGGISQQEKNLLSEMDRRLLSGERLTREEQSTYNRLVDLEHKPLTGPNPTKFSQWQEPGGENYRELLLTLPGPKVDRFDAFDARMRKHFNLTTEEELKLSARQRSEMRMKYVEETGDSVADMRQDFRSSHYDEPNILAHVRFNERVDADGKKVLFIEEIQSDWAQKGRKEGFQPTNQEQIEASNKIKELRKQQQKVFSENNGLTGQQRNQEWDRIENEIRPFAQIASNRSGLPPKAPFVKDTGKWSMLAMKRMVRWAAENGFDRVAWTPGAMQVKRYQDAMRAVVDKISWEDVGKGKQIWGHKGNDIPFTGRINERGIFETGPAQGKTVEEMLGKDTAQKILKDAKGELSEKEMTIGGEGMKGYYDQILPAEVNKFFGKSQWGNARVGETKISIGDLSVSEARGHGIEPTHKAGTKKYYTPVHSLDITPQMRIKATTEGMPLFSVTGFPGLNFNSKENENAFTQKKGNALTR